MRRNVVTRIAAAAFARLPATGHAGTGIIDGMKLGVLDHDVPIGGDHKGLGSRLLFQEKIDLGYRFTWRSNVSLFLDHISDANITQHNPGLTNLGVRFGFKF
ncbi:MAG: acyloxyacyl hydrolase [Alphaproteobacteria bacterium]|nr:acyloxyacyl hydrolase [Alphaproteobacteria bacterium]